MSVRPVLLQRTILLHACYAQLLSSSLLQQTAVPCITRNIMVKVRYIRQYENIGLFDQSGVDQ